MFEISLNVISYTLIYIILADLIILGLAEYAHHYTKKWWLRIFWIPSMFHSYWFLKAFYLVVKSHYG